MRSALAARRAAKLFLQQRIQLAAFPPDYAYRKLFLKRDILSPNEMALRRACAGQIVLCRLRQMGKDAASVAVIAKMRSAELDRAIAYLACRVRYLTLDIPRGETLIAQLRLQYGIAARVREEKHDCCDLALIWDEADEKPTCPTLNLSDKNMTVDYFLADGARLPQGIKCELLAALMQENPSFARRIEVRGVRWI